MNNLELQQLREVAFYLEGLKKGQGNLLPLGTAHLETLWYAHKVLSNK